MSPRAMWRRTTGEEESDRWVSGRESLDAACRWGGRRRWLHLANKLGHTVIVRISKVVGRSPSSIV